MPVSAYVLVRCRGATEGKIAEIIRTKPHVKRVDTVFGDYDIIAYLEFEELPSSFSVAELHNIVTEEILPAITVSMDPVSPLFFISSPVTNKCQTVFMSGPNQSTLGSGPIEWR